MSFAKIFSAQTRFLCGEKIDVEIDITNGMHSFSIVGLGDRSVDEARDRVSSALKNCGFVSPKQQNQKVVVALAPANTKKTGTNFDVAIALAYLKAKRELEFDSNQKIFVGELSLDGYLKPIRGIIPIIQFAKENNFKEVFIPKENTKEARIISGIKIFGANHFNEIVNHLKNKVRIEEILEKKINFINKTESIDWGEIKGNEGAKRAIQIAACGGHNVALFGPPGTGKTMLARSMSGILPELSYKEIVECSSIHSVAGKNKNLLINRPFRAPHHTSSYVSIVGGGNDLLPGEITLAHNGILFLDEFPEFDKRVIDSLRQPLEDKTINISRAKGSAIYPANFILVVSMNPCPCGYFGNQNKKCVCTTQNIENYRKKISGPIIDRIDIWVEVAKVDYENLFKNKKEEKLSEKIQKEIKDTRNIQLKRAEKLNSDMKQKEIKKFCELEEKDKNFLNETAKKLNFSARTYFKIIKVARTIADMEKSEKIKSHHILEAIQYRSKNIYDK